MDRAREGTRLVGVDQVSIERVRMELPLFFSIGCAVVVWCGVEAVLESG